MNTKIHEFNSVVENIKKIIDANKNVELKLDTLCTFIDAISFKASFANDPDKYFREKVFDAMNYIKYNLIMENKQNANALHVYNSIYYIIHNYYFK